MFQVMSWNISSSDSIDFPFSRLPVPVTRTGRQAGTPLAFSNTSTIYSGWPVRNRSISGNDVWSASAASLSRITICIFGLLPTLTTTASVGFDFEGFGTFQHRYYSCATQTHLAGWISALEFTWLKHVRLRARWCRASGAVLVFTWVAGGICKCNFASIARYTLISVLTEHIK